MLTVTLALPVSVSARPASITGFKSVPGLRCPCSLATRPVLKRSLMHTLVLTGSGLQAATGLETGGNGITGRIVSRSASEMTVSLKLAASMPLGTRTISVMTRRQVLGRFTVQVGRLGRIDRVTPNTVLAGSTARVIVSGRDIAGGQLAGPSWATIEAATADEMRVRLTVPASQMGATVRLRFYETEPDRRRSYWQQQPLIHVGALAATPKTALTPSQPPKPSSRLSAPLAPGCLPPPVISDPRRAAREQAPRLLAPADKSEFLAGTTFSRQVTFRWRSMVTDAVSVFEYYTQLDLNIVGAARVALGQATSAGGPTWHSHSLNGTTYTTSFRTAGSPIHWRVSSKRCGQSTPYSPTWQFSIK